MAFLSEVAFCRRRCCGVLAGRQTPPRPLTLPSGCCGPPSLTGLSPPLRPPTRSPELPPSSHPVSTVNRFYQHGLIYRAFQRSRFKTVLFFPLKEVWGGSDQRRRGGGGAPGGDADLAPHQTGRHEDHYWLRAALSTG